MKEPYYADAHVVLYHGDSRELLPELERYDACITDPPYGIAFRSNMRTATDKFSKIAGDGAVDVSWITLMKEPSVIALFTRWDVMDAWRIAIGGVLPVRGCVIWEKPGGGMGDLERSYALDYEMILYASYDEWRVPGHRYGSVWRNGKDAASSYLHPTQKPLGIMEMVVDRFTLPNWVVLDPFAGSGTTLVAAKNLGRRAIGIEVEERYCEVAANRCIQEVLPL